MMDGVQFAFRVVALFAASVVLSPAQFRDVEITFRGSGCESCTKALPDRLQRVRGVKSASVDSERGSVRVRLATPNRLRLEQLRDAIEQDGTRTIAATVEVEGQLSEAGGVRILQPDGVRASYVVEAGTQAMPPPGRYVVQGSVSNLHSQTGRVTIKATAFHSGR